MKTAWRPLALFSIIAGGIFSIFFLFYSLWIGAALFIALSICSAMGYKYLPT